MKVFHLLALILITVATQAQPVLPSADLYGIGNWDRDSLGNHRAVVRVEKKGEAVRSYLPWRLRLQHPENNQIWVIDAATGKRILNVRKVFSNREYCDIIFKPETVPGDYYVYYLKTLGKRSAPYQKLVYENYSQTADPGWLQLYSNKRKIAKLPRAELLRFESIDEFNSFYPMEVIATKAEKEKILKELGIPVVIFTEDRRFPVRMTSDIPYRWVEEGKHDSFDGMADRGEFYPFQIAVWAAKKPVSHIKVEFHDLVSESGAHIPSSSFTCFNTEGTDVFGKVFDKECNVAEGKVQTLWLGTQINENVAPGRYSGTVSVTGDGLGKRDIRLTLNVSSRLINNSGDDDTWRFSRLRWLNSALAEDDEVVAPMTPLQIEGKSISCLGRKVTLDPTGLPSQIFSFFSKTMTRIDTVGRQMLSSPITFRIEGDNSEWKNLDFEYVKRKHGAVSWSCLNRNDSFLMRLNGGIEADGNILYQVTLVSLKDQDVKDIRLEANLLPGVAEYFMGLGEKGGRCPDKLDWKWNVRRNQDGPWIGDVNAGLQIRLFDDKYIRPLNTNFYQQQPLVMPDSWFNEGKGGISIRRSADGSSVTSYSGERSVKAGQALKFYFNLAVTPFKTIDPHKNWHDRYYHQYDKIEKIKEYGGTVINVHHATDINPFINYPYLRPKAMKSYIDSAHVNGMKVKIYDTVRELSNSATELPALRSLGNEIFPYGAGGGYSWLQEHLDQDYIPAWYAYRVRDAAVLNTGVSRWHNYYIEGLNWLVRNIGIDGLYIDDLAFDRTTMKRVRKVLARNNPEAMIDLHSCNQYNERDGYANSANLYLEHFPYIDRLWFGENFNYDEKPDFWLIELSGIPYGLMGEMLQDGGNPWRGMLFGMTQRAPWAGDPRNIWNIWDDFGIDDSEMIGWWAENCPVKTHSNNTLATSYVRNGERSLISIATWADSDATVNLEIDWAALGLNQSECILHAPEITGFQHEHTWMPGESITVPVEKGWLIYIEKR